MKFFEKFKFWVLVIQHLILSFILFLSNGFDYQMEDYLWFGVVLGLKLGCPKFSIFFRKEEKKFWVEVDFPFVERFAHPLFYEKKIWKNKLGLVRILIYRWNQRF